VGRSMKAGHSDAIPVLEAPGDFKLCTSKRVMKYSSAALSNTSTLASVFISRVSAREFQDLQSPHLRTGDHVTSFIQRISSATSARG
jgi:hypothetical protein